MSNAELGPVLSEAAPISKGGPRLGFFLGGRNQSSLRVYLARTGGRVARWIHLCALARRVVSHRRLQLRSDVHMWPARGPLVLCPPSLP